MIPVTRTYIPDFKTYTSYLENIWRSGQLTNNGPLSRTLQERIKVALGVTNFELVANGTLALQLAIRALGLQGEIITTPYSYVATTNAILWEGCTPGFVDIDAQSFCIDPDLIEQAITKDTCAILATHVYGYPCDVERLDSISKQYGLKVIYDASHTFGVRLNGSSLLVHGDCSTLSFHATKLFHSCEGGGVVCKSAELAQQIFLMSKFGHIGEDEYLDVGINAKMSELHAAMGLCVLPHVQEIIACRRKTVEIYDEYLNGSSLGRPRIPEGLEYNYAYYPVVFSSHDAMMYARKALNDIQVFPRRYFYPSLNTLPFLKYNEESCPISEKIAERVLCLPLYVGIEKDDILKISKIVAGTL